MSNTFTTTESTSFFGRIGSALLGFLLGPLLLVVAACLIFWNESNSVRTTRSLNEGAAAVQEADAADFQPSNAGKLLHLTGDAMGSDQLTDPVFGVSSPGIRLDRRIQVYAWTEHESSRTSTSASGTKTTTKTYTYEKKWVGTLPKSSSFKQPDEHENPTELKYEASSFAADDVSLGAYKLDHALVEKLTDTKPVALKEENLQLPDGATLHGEKIYVGAHPDAPEIGDEQVTEVIVPNGPVSVVASQGPGSRLAEFHAKAGGTVGLIEAGSKTAAEMFAAAHHSNQITTWLIRAGGFVLLLIAFLLLSAAFTTLASIIPFFGSMIEAGVFLLCLFASLAVWMFLVAAAWIVARPLLGGGLFAIALLGLILTILHIRKGRARQRVLAVGVPSAA